MNIEHLGAKNCVTGSCHLVQTRPGSDSGVNILVDCGKTYGNDPELPFDRFPVLPRDIDYLFLTHAHIDHIGRVPDLIDAGFQGEIICTHATKVLLIPMLHDALSFTDKSDKQVQRLETAIDELSWGFEYNEVFALKKGINFKFGNAGHILGSCFILLFFQGIWDARIRPSCLILTNRIPVICLCWNPPMATGIIPAERTGLMS